MKLGEKKLGAILAVHPLKKIVKLIYKIIINDIFFRETNQTGLDKSPKTSMFSGTIAASQKSQLDCGECDTNESPKNFCEYLFGAYTEINIGNFEIKFLCLGVSSCSLTPSLL